MVGGTPQPAAAQRMLAEGSRHRRSQRAGGLAGGPGCGWLGSWAGRSWTRQRDWSSGQLQRRRPVAPPGSLPQRCALLGVSDLASSPENAAHSTHPSEVVHSCALEKAMTRMQGGLHRRRRQSCACGLREPTRKGSNSGVLGALSSPPGVLG